MHESNASDAPQEGATARAKAWAPDLLTGVGVLAAAAGAGVFHVGAGLVVFGLALVLIGSRAATTGG
jgi:hypothetical protein